MDAGNITLIVMTGLNLILGTFVYFRNRKNEVNISFASFSFFIAIWSLTLALFRLETNLEMAIWWMKFTYVSAVFIACSFWYFSVKFPKPKKLSWIHKMGIFIPTIIIFSLLVFPQFLVKEVFVTAWGKEVVLDRLHHILFAIYFAFFFFGGLFIAWKKFRSATGILKRQLLYIIASVLIAGSLGVFFNLILPAFQNHKYIWIGPIFTATIVVCIFYAIVKYRLMDIRFVISRSLLYVLLVAAVTTMFATLTYIILPFFGEQFGVSTFALIVITSLIIVLGLDPLKRLLGQATDSVFFKSRVDYQDLLRKLSECISLEINLESLISSTLKTIRTELKLDQARLFVTDQKSGIFISSVDLSNNKRVIRLKKNHSLIAYLKKYRDLIITEELDREIIDLPDSSQKKKLKLIKKELSSLSAALTMPIMTEGTLTGILVLGSKRSGDVFNNDDISLLQVFAPQLGTALEKARLYKEAKDFTVKLKQEVQRATSDLRQKNIELEERNVYLQALQTITTLATRVLDFKRVTQMVVDGIAKELGYLGGMLLIIDKKRDRIYIEAYTSTPLTEKAAKLLPRPVKSYYGKFSQGGTLSIQAAVSNSVKIGESFADFISPPCPRSVARMMQGLMKMKSIAAVPVVSEDRVVGILLFTLTKKNKELSDIDFHVMKSLANQTGVIYKNLELLEEIKETNQKLTIANEHLKDLDKAKSEFMSIASHQLRTPLSGIMGYLSMLAEGDYGKMASQQSKVVDELLAASQRLIRMVNLFLNVTRIEAGRFKLMRSPINVADIIVSEVREMLVPAKQKGLKLEFKKPRKKLPVLNIDEDKIKDVVLNLVDNAIKYTEKGKITIQVEVSNNFLTVSVTDTGVGIPRGEAEKLFLKFVRGTGVARLSPDGAGLGLFIAKKIVEEHGGRIWAESEGEAKGSTFSFRLPVR